MTDLPLNNYKQQIADFYSSRSHNYDESDWHYQIACRLVQYAQINSGQSVLDIATGTGMVALEAAKMLNPEGRVIGVDISEGMLDQAQHKAKALNLKNVEFILADAEKLNFSSNSFARATHGPECARATHGPEGDRVLCASALIWMTDIVAALRLWRQFLKPDGIIGIHVFADTAFVGSNILQNIGEKYGVSLTFSKPTGTIEKCQKLLTDAGFQVLEIKTEQDGSYISLEEAKKMWAINGNPAPGQFPHPLSLLSCAQQEQIHQEFDAAIEALVTPKGIWNDITTFFILGRRSPVGF
jgi:ubiquinone/menaquinone biosynthesis C-methylase UbiE